MIFRGPPRGREAHAPISKTNRLKDGGDISVGKHHNVAYVGNGVETRRRKEDLEEVGPIHTDRTLFASRCRNGGPAAVTLPATFSKLGSRKTKDISKRSRVVVMKSTALSPSH